MAIENPVVKRPLGHPIGRRKKPLVATAIGLSLSLGIGTLLALTSDSVTSQGNKAESGTYAPPAHDLKAARVAHGASCTGATFEDSPFTAAISSAGANIDLAAGNHVSSDDFCLKNAGTEVGRLLVRYTNVADIEVGSCETTEAGAGGDTSCADGAQGELKPLLVSNVINIPSTSTSASCGNSGASFTSHETTGGTLDPDIAPGEICTVAIDISSFGTDAQKLAAQTDKVQWDIVFRLEDV